MALFVRSHGAYCWIAWIAVLCALTAMNAAATPDDPTLANFRSQGERSESAVLVERRPYGIKALGGLARRSSLPTRREWAIIPREVRFNGEGTRGCWRKLAGQGAIWRGVSRPNADVVPPEAVKLVLERTHYLTITAL
ncbi:hypothetical protein Bbelb_029880 [Branchiostoma belcheri]|nr:hypothetical protein Bbelb_029880 [Branchiostoma belcheri]